MAKKEKSEQKANLYLLAIVAIVAVVGVVVLVLNSGSLVAGVGEEENVVGMALSSASKAALKLKTRCNYDAYEACYDDCFNDWDDCINDCPVFDYDCREEECSDEEDVGYACLKTNCCSYLSKRCPGDKGGAYPGDDDEYYTPYEANCE